ncbi:MAG: AAA-like domain-containing protein [Desulfobacterales bacterium]|nr:AAA-like domain-containing protein [Desulfobacterales bacterium]
MREFNTTGPCDPALHYTVMREGLIAVGKEKVRKGRYFTIFAPRQSGKTTYFQLLMDSLRKESYTPVWISFENLKTATKEDFYFSFHHQLTRGLLEYNIHCHASIRNGITLNLFFEQIRQETQKLVMIIDEFEGIPECVVSEVMHSFRMIYHQRQFHALHSLILVGVSTLAELVVSQASPFNIADELKITYFTFNEVQDLISQYTQETGQAFESDVIKAIYENTAGQPGLVCALCQYLTTEIPKVISQPITIQDFYTTLKVFLTKKLDKNILNIVQKAREKREFMLKFLFKDEPVEFTVDDPNISYLYANGVIDEVNGYVQIPVPLYAKRLINAFRPLLNGETEHYITSSHDTLSKYLTSEGELNLNILLEEYRAYVRRRGFHAFDTENLKEAAWHYSLDGFIHFYIQSLGGQTFIEVPSGKGRTDILILYKRKSYIIETKRFVSQHYFNQGKAQLLEYMKSERLSDGYYVVFSNKHTETDALRSEDLIENRRIYTHIIPISFEQPSRVAVPDIVKLTEAEKIALNMVKTGFTHEQIVLATRVEKDRIEQLGALLGWARGMFRIE